MTILNRIASNWSFQEREKLNNNWAIIEGYLSNLQGQVNILTGDVNVQDIVDQINELLNQGNIVIADLKTALQDATTVITNAQNATTDANNAAQEALDAINDMQAFINQFGNAESYDNSKLYKVNNLVEYDGSGFICIKETQGNPPPTLPTKRNEWWQLFAQKGLDGTGAVSKVAGKSPELDGNVPLTAQDVGAVSRDYFDTFLAKKTCRFDSDSFGRFDGFSGGRLNNNFMQRVARTKNLNIVNVAVGGALVTEAWKRIKEEVYLPSIYEYHFINVGYNDIRTKMNDDGIVTGVAHYLKNIVAFLRLSFIKDNRDSSITYSGLWETLEPYDDFYSSGITYTSQAGAYLETSFEGNAVTIGTVINNMSGTYEIYIDGSLLKSTNLKSTVGYTFANTAIEIVNLEEGIHTLKIIAVGDGNVYIDWIGVPSKKPPVIWVNAITKMLNIHYISPITPTITSELNLKIRELLSEFDERVIFIDQSDFDPNKINLLEEDTYHPNDLGHEWIASNVLKRWSTGIGFD